MDEKNRKFVLYSNSLRLFKKVGGRDRRRDILV